MHGLAGLEDLNVDLSLTGGLRDVFQPLTRFACGPLGYFESRFALRRLNVIDYVKENRLTAGCSGEREGVRDDHQRPGREISGDQYSRHDYLLSILGSSRIRSVWAFAE